MPNSYFVAPQILPGNVVISGDQLRIGAAAPYVYLGKAALQTLELSLNREIIAPRNKDNATQFDHRYSVSTATRRAMLQLFNPANQGTDFMLLRAEEARVLTTTTHTGTLVETTLRSLLIRAGILGRRGGFRALVALIANAQGGVATTFRFKFGGVTLHAPTVAAVETWYCVWDLRDRAVDNAQHTSLTVLANGVTPRVSHATAAVDTALDQTLELTAQLGALADSWDVRTWVVELIHSDEP